MKLHVILDSEGNVVGTASFTGDKGAPNYSRVSSGPGRSIHQVEIAADLSRVKSAAELHEKILQSATLPRAADMQTKKD